MKNMKKIIALLFLAIGMTLASKSQDTSLTVGHTNTNHIYVDGCSCYCNQFFVSIISFTASPVPSNHYVISNPYGMYVLNSPGSPYIPITDGTVVNSMNSPSNFVITIQHKTDEPWGCTITSPESNDVIIVRGQVCNYHWDCEMLGTTPPPTLTTPTQPVVKLKHMKGRIDLDKPYIKRIHNLMGQQLSSVHGLCIITYFQNGIVESFQEYVN